ncbi:MAG: aldehyde dehydrogenase family protein, partial [Pseudomonadota bacterium]
LGGNAPFIVFKDADLDKAIEGVVTSKFRNAGQTCICANRIFVHDDIYESFLERFTAKTAALEIGQGQADTVDIGPMISEDAVSKTKEILDDALAKGAVLKYGGKLRDDLGPQFFEPAVITKVDSSMRCFSEEIFGPVAAVYPFSSTEEAVKLANDTEYGLAAYIYTQDLETAWRVPEALEYGMVGVNSSLLSTPQAPFGGVKMSGIGREGSKYGLEEYVETKYLSIQF